MDELSALRYTMPIIVSTRQHCDEQQFRTLHKLMYITHIDVFLSVVEGRFIHTSTTTRSHSCSEKSTRTLRVHLVKT